MAASTGASSGLGEATARLPLREAMRIGILAYRFERFHEEG